MNNQHVVLLYASSLVYSLKISIILLCPQNGVLPFPEEKIPLSIIQNVCCIWKICYTFQSIWNSLLLYFFFYIFLKGEKRWERAWTSHTSIQILTMEPRPFWGRNACDVNAKNICFSQATIFCRYKVIWGRILLWSMKPHYQQEHIWCRAALQTCY